MSDNTRKFSAIVSTRYGIPEKDIYQQVIDLAKKNNLAKSRAQLLLVERGLVHTQNPEPLIKEVEKKVYVDRPVEKVVYKDRPKEEHITEHLSNELGEGKKTQLRPSADKLSTGDKANPHLALGEKKSANNSNVGGWILGLSVVGVIIYGLIKKYT